MNKNPTVNVGSLYLLVIASNAMVRPVGIEPTTIGLKGHCSTTELQALGTSDMPTC